MFFGGWEPVVRALVLGALGYVALVVLLRVSGKRTLSKMNAFDFVVTITLGSVFAALIVDPGVTLAVGVTAFAVLIAAQFAVTFLSVRFPSVEQLVKAEPTLLYHDGAFLRGAMRRTRVTEAEVLAAARSSGALSLDTVRAVVLETDSTFSVISGEGELGALTNVEPLRSGHSR